jgi:phosphopantetheine adenylyltransferase
MEKGARLSPGYTYTAIGGRVDRLHPGHGELSRARGEPVRFRAAIVART